MPLKACFFNGKNRIEERDIETFALTWDREDWIYISKNGWEVPITKIKEIWESEKPTRVDSATLHPITTLKWLRENKINNYYAVLNAVLD